MQSNFGTWQSIIYACVATAVIALAAAVVLYTLQEPSSAVFSVPGSVRL